jgi:CRISPR-associated protein Cmr3
MNTYQITPLAPLVFRSGKPFGTETRADGGSLPLPSSVAGMLRTASADAKGEAYSPGLRNVPAGALLTRREKDGGLTPLFPKPADALYLEEDKKTRLIRCSPRSLDKDCGCDLPGGLLPVRMEEKIDGKPVPGAAFWTLRHLEQWGKGLKIDFDAIDTEGEKLPQADLRTHVALDAHTRAAESGKLFQTGSLDLAPQKKGDGWADSELVFLARSTAAIHDGLVNFGGERRLARLTQIDGGWPRCPDDLQAGIENARGLRLTLATPAIFAKGYLPDWLDENLQGAPPGCPGLTLKLRAAAVERWLPVSGWDLAAWAPRAMRKAVATGAVYWFEIVGGNLAEAAEKLWLAALSDEEQDRLDGFGLALPAPWQVPHPDC